MITANEIYEYVLKHDWVTFAELKNRFGGDGSLDGDFSLYCDERGSLVLWANMSENFVDAIKELLVGNLLFLWPTQYLTYLIDGHALTLPIAKRPPKRGYKEPHWVPVCLRACSMKKKPKTPAFRDAIIPRRP